MADTEAEWIMPKNDDGMSDPIEYQVRCSNCGFDMDPQTYYEELKRYQANKFCPKCGAKMKGCGLSRKEAVTDIETMQNLREVHEQPRSEALDIAIRTMTGVDNAMAEMKEKMSTAMNDRYESGIRTAFNVLKKHVEG